MKIIRDRGAPRRLPAICGNYYWAVVVTEGGKHVEARGGNSPCRRNAEQSHREALADLARRYPDAAITG